MPALSNIRVVDLTHVVAGPFCTFQLAVMGADVIKIEPPLKPDMCRAKSTDFPSGEDGLGPFFTSQNANKKSLPVDLDSEDGRALVFRLIESADVLVENYRSGAMAEIGLDYESVKRIRPDIIYCSMTGFGQTGPKGQHTAYDNVIQAFSGLMAANGDETTAPVKIGPPILDFGTGIQAAFAISCALLQRAHTGQGQYIDIAMVDAALMLMSCNLTYLQQNGTVPPLGGNDSRFNAGYCCYTASDGEQLMLGAFTGTQVADLWAVLGDADYGERFRGAQAPAMIPSVDSDKRRIAEIIRTRTAQEWEDELNTNKVPAARVRTLDQTLRENQLDYRSVLQTPESADPDNAAHRRQSFPTAAFSYLDDGPALKTPPPVFAEHAHEILGGLGYSSEEILDLANRGVIALADDI
ncbi:MAG: CoA transferase [Pseudomonadota bacterium]